MGLQEISSMFSQSQKYNDAIAPIGGGRERFGAAMRRILLLAFILLCARIPARAQEECQFGGGDNFNALVKALSEAKSCSAAVTKFRRCAWGSSADTQFAPIVIEKCEKAFLDKLSPAASKRYAEEMQLCGYRYARQGGTMWMAIAAGCQVDVAANFAANPAAGKQPAPRASFDCDKAQTLLERAICSDIRLGHADIVLSRVYSDRLKNSKDDRPALIRSEKRWLQGVPAKCKVTSERLPPEALNCVRNEFEKRFTMLDSCLDKIAACLQSPGDDDEVGTAAAATSKPRASFDCEAPSTPLEIVICADARLGQTDIKLAEAYHDADKTMATQHQDLVDSERQWLRFVNGACPMGAVGGIPSVFTRSCVQAAFENRIVQLETCPKKQPQDRLACLNDFQLLEKK